MEHSRGACDEEVRTSVLSGVASVFKISRVKVSRSRMSFIHGGVNSEEHSLCRETTISEEDVKRTSKSYKTAVSCLYLMGPRGGRGEKKWQGTAVCEHAISLRVQVGCNVYYDYRNRRFLDARKNSSTLGFIRLDILSAGRRKINEREVRKRRT